jgi:Flp pilus assembly protein TadG
VLAFQLFREGFVTMKNLGESGQALAETAISLSLLLILAMATMDFGYLFFTKLTLQNAVRQANRYAVTGQCISGSDGTCTQTRYNSIIATLQDNSLGLLNSGNTGDVSVTCTNDGGGCPNNAGGPGDLVTISVSYPYSFLSPLLGTFFSGHAYTIGVSATSMNEPFPPGAS